MVQSFLPLTRSANLPVTPKKETRLGLEIALPVTLLAFIAAAEVSPMLKMHLERIVDWLCDHDSVATAIEVFIAAIPIWMGAVIILDKRKSSN